MNALTIARPVAGNPRRGVAPAGVVMEWAIDLLPGLGLAALAVAMAGAGGGGAARLAYPLLSLVIAGGLLVTRRAVAYLSFVMWLFVLTPGVRRYVDLQVGFEQVNTIMLAPWLASALALGPALLCMAMARGAARGPLAGGALAVILAATYGLVIATLEGRAVSAGFDWLRWVVPPALAVQVVAWLPAHPDLPRRVLRGLCIAAALSAVYGVYQFVTAPPWDGFWMVNSKMESIGVPEPFAVRVFSTLNSPGSYAVFLVVALLVLLARPGLLGLLGTGLAAMALALTLVRSAWAVAAIGVLYIVLRGGVAAHGRLAMAVGAAALALPVALAVPEVGKLLEDRFLSITRLSGDASLADRSSAYSDLAENLGETPFGEGIGISGSYQSFVDGGRPRIIDGMPLEVYYALGIPAGTLYFLGAVGCLLPALRTGLRAGGADRGVLAATAATLACVPMAMSGSPLIGESGVFFWFMIALCHAAPVRTGRRVS